MHASFQYFQGGIVISMKSKTAMWAIMLAVFQFLGNPVSASGADLTCAPWVYFDQLAPGAFSLVRQHPNQSSKSRVTEISTKTSSLSIVSTEVDQLLNIQILDTDCVILIDQFSRDFIVCPSPALMDRRRFRQDAYVPPVRQRRLLHWPAPAPLPSEHGQGRFE